jgi:hypothetical protein
MAVIDGDVNDVWVKASRSGSLSCWKGLLIQNNTLVQYCWIQQCLGGQVFYKLVSFLKVYY